MLTADDVILQHGARLYDPQKRHERYIRTRQLKGRVAGTSRPVPSGPSTANPYHQSGPSNTPYHSKSNAEKVQNLRDRLTNLQSVLHDLVRQAKARSGIEVGPASESSSTTTESKTKKSSSSTKDSPDKPKTAAEKRDDAERQKKYREQQQREHPTKSQEVASLNRQITETQDRIHKMRQTLASARNRSGPKYSAGSVGASSTNTK